VRSRVKQCESAIASLRRRQEETIFHIDRADSYTLTNLKDLAGVRVLVFPRNRLGEIDAMLRQLKLFSSWTADPIRGDAGEALKILGQLSAGQ
jgi:ppGpp synthetase/RelA/SpoT-type nucleotidyltranferase